MNLSARTALLVVILGISCKNAFSKIHVHSDNPAVNDFTKEFSKLIRNNKPVSKVLNVVDMKTPEGGKAAFDVIDSFLKNRHNSEAKDIAEETKDVVVKSLGHVTTDQLAVALGFNLAESLGKRGLLTKDNASQLADEAVNDIANAVKEMGAASPEEKVSALLSGYDKFISRFGLNLSNLAEEIIDDIKEELL